MTRAGTARLTSARRVEHRLGVDRLDLVLVEHRETAVRAVPRAVK